MKISNTHHITRQGKLKSNPTDFKVGDRVQLRSDVLLRHSKSVPAHLGYTKEQFSWRATLDNLEGKTGVVQRIFPNSNHINIDFNGYLIGINKSELVKIKDNKKYEIKKVGEKYMIVDKEVGEFLIGYTFDSIEEAQSFIGEKWKENT